MKYLTIKKSRIICCLFFICLTPLNRGLKKMVQSNKLQVQFFPWRENRSRGKDILSDRKIHTSINMLWSKTKQKFDMVRFKKSSKMESTTPSHWRSCRVQPQPRYWRTLDLQRKVNRFIQYSYSPKQWDIFFLVSFIMLMYCKRKSCGIKNNLCWVQQSPKRSRKCLLKPQCHLQWPSQYP